MANIGKTVAKNAGILFSTQFVTWGLSLVVTIFLSRFLGPEGTGKLNLANSLWAIMIIVATFGLDSLLTKEIARSSEDLSEILGTTIVLRSIIFVIGSLIVLAYSFAVGYPLDTIQVIIIAGFNALLLQQINTFDAAFRGMERMEFNSIPLIGGKFAYALLIVISILLNASVHVIAAVSIAASLINLGAQIFFFGKLHAIRLKFNRARVIWLIKGGLPFLFVSVFIVIYHQVDVVILSLLLNEQAVGWYGAATHITGNLLFVPTVFMTAIFPTLSRLYVGAKDSMQLLFCKSFNLLLIIGVAVGLGIMLVAPSFVTLIYGPAYEKSGLILSFRGIVLIVTYMNMLVGLYFVTSDRQHVWTWVMAVATVLTIPLDLLLIPICEQIFANGAVGGAVSYLFTETGMFLFGFIKLRREVFNWDTVNRGMRIVAAGLGMVAITWYFRSMFIVIPVLIGGVSYTALILLLQVLTKEDRMLLASVAQKALDRFRGRRVSPVDAG